MDIHTADRDNRTDIGTMPRRAFLSGLARLPLIGGAVSLIGAPTASAEPISDELLWSYKDWLHYEHRMLSFELAGFDIDRARCIERYSEGSRRGTDWHFQWCRDGLRGPAGWIDAPQPSTRAALVLSAVGCDWRD